MKLSVRQRSSVIVTLAKEASEAIQGILRSLTDDELQFALRCPLRRVKIDEAQRILVQCLISEAVIHLSSLVDTSEGNGEAHLQRLLQIDHLLSDTDTAQDIESDALVSNTELKHTVENNVVWKDEPSSELDENPGSTERELCAEVTEPEVTLTWPDSERSQGGEHESSTDSGNASNALELLGEGRETVSILRKDNQIDSVTSIIFPSDHRKEDSELCDSVVDCSDDVEGVSRALKNNQRGGRSKKGKGECKNKKKYPDKQKQCDMCGALVCDLARHRNSHTGEKPYSCQYCDKTFTDPSLLNQHRKIMHLEKKFVCDICGYKCGVRSKLTVHLNRHNNIRPYKCDLCDRGFVSGTKMRQHRRTHTGEKPHQCHLCHLKLSRRNYLHDHLRSQHGIIVKKDGNGRPGGKAPSDSEMHVQGRLKGQRGLAAAEKVSPDSVSLFSVSDHKPLGLNSNSLFPSERKSLLETEVMYLPEVRPSAISRSPKPDVT